ISVGRPRGAVRTARARARRQRSVAPGRHGTSPVRGPAEAARRIHRAYREERTMRLTDAAERLVYSPYDYAIHDDPYPTYARLREEAPLYRNDDLDFWALSRHADVVAAYRDTTRFSSANGVSLEPTATGPHASRTMSFLAMDPPKHARMR